MRQCGSTVHNAEITTLTCPYIFRLRHTLNCFTVCRRFMLPSWKRYVLLVMEKKSLESLSSSINYHLVELMWQCGSSVHMPKLPHSTCPYIFRLRHTVSQLSQPWPDHVSVIYLLHPAICRCCSKRVCTFLNTHLLLFTYLIVDFYRIVASSVLILRYVIYYLLYVILLFPYLYVCVFGTYFILSLMLIIYLCFIMLDFAN